MNAVTLDQGHYLGLPPERGEQHELFIDSGPVSCAPERAVRSIRPLESTRQSPHQQREDGSLTRSRKVGSLLAQTNRLVSDMAQKILLVVASLVLLFIVVVMAQPSVFHVERSVEIAASPEVVWAEISNFKQWKGWSHWDKSDPSQKTTITGDAGSVGHKTEWNGEKTGQGTMTITEASAPTRMVFKLEFKKPMESEAVAAFDMVAAGAKTKVTWSLDGHNNFMGKFFGLLMGVEDMIGSAYEDSLTNLTDIAEEHAKGQAEAKAAEAKAAAADATNR
ncbi:MAG: SRPBCC family protein [Nannocystaceae bacterium]